MAQQSIEVRRALPVRAQPADDRAVQGYAPGIVIELFGERIEAVRIEFHRGTGIQGEVAVGRARCVN
jgi:hypothetical protein